MYFPNPTRWTESSSKSVFEESEDVPGECGGSESCCQLHVQEPPRYVDHEDKCDDPGTRSSTCGFGGTTGTGCASTDDCPSGDTCTSSLLCSSNQVKLCADGNTCTENSECGGEENGTYYGVCEPPSNYPMNLYCMSSLQDDRDICKAC